MESSFFMGMIFGLIGFALAIFFIKIDTKGHLKIPKSTVDERQQLIGYQVSSHTLAFTLVLLTISIILSAFVPQFTFSAAEQGTIILIASLTYGMVETIIRGGIPIGKEKFNPRFWTLTISFMGFFVLTQSYRIFFEGRASFKGGHFTEEVIVLLFGLWTLLMLSLLCYGCSQAYKNEREDRC